MEILVHREECDLELLDRCILKVLEASRASLKTFVMDFVCCAFDVLWNLFGKCDKIKDSHEFQQAEVH